MVNTLWLVRKLGDFSSDLVDEERDIVILIQDGVLRIPTKKGWFVCKEDAQARGIKVPESIAKSYEEIAQLIVEAKKVVVW
ncbi:sulfurtransferase TusB [Hydrogenobacter hydrogenophilus]|uniref:Sulfur transfer complex TusBCD TusB component, DsrH family n=1 Tax=Hydrogenobacter hydrogenophilus TaxID=35835 RepID=A0A285P843_9AQUI|nr:sulfurtransferase TusB [Hydrogenobacter hydrogenophilus]SNZ16316.1 Sulfur transfer complex TusBCD TusB component, DsrH family [Hydrogenobacter hydrogenophilus]